MNDETLKQLLKQADANTDFSAMDTRFLSLTVRYKFKRQKQIRRNTAAAGMVILAVMGFCGRQIYQSRQKQSDIARMEQEIKTLTRQTESTLALLQEVLARQKQQDTLRALNRQLASSTGTTDSIEAEVDEAVFVLMYQADLMMKEPNTKDLALENYKCVIKYFPNNRLAKTAEERLKQIEQENPQI